MRGVLYLVAGLAMACAVGLLVDKQLERSAFQGEVNSLQWERENTNINIENYKKILNTQEQPLFRSLGYLPPAPAPDRRRVLVVGDSFIWGDGLNNINLAWWRQLQWELERRGYADVDVIAAGRNGASTQDEYAWLSDPALLEQAKPDAVVVGYVTNDPKMKYDNGEEMVKQLPPNLFVEYFKYSQAARLFPTLSFQLASRAAGKLHATPSDETGYPYTDWELKILEGESFRAYQAVIGKLADKVQELKAPLFFVTTPNVPMREYYEARYAPVRSLFQKAGIEFNDLLPALLQYCDKEQASNLAFGINPANSHPGARITHFYASEVADILASRYPQAIGPKSAAPAGTPAINDWMPASVNPKATAPGAWLFKYPSEGARLLRMPVEEPHVALNFERPVAIRQIKLNSAKPGSFKVWAMLLDDKGNYELKDYVPLGQGEGAEVLITLPPGLSEKRITSLRIARRAAQSPVEIFATVEPSKLQANGGHAYFYPEAAPPGADGSPVRPDLLLLEDGKPLPFPDSLHDDIRVLGKGRYSFWDGKLLFSSSDGSNPQRNGKRYALAKQASDAVAISIDFNSPAVRL